MAERKKKNKLPPPPQQQHEEVHHIPPAHPQSTATDANAPHPHATQVDPPPLRDGECDEPVGHVKSARARTRLLRFFTHSHRHDRPSRTPSHSHRRSTPAALGACRGVGPPAHLSTSSPKQSQSRVCHTSSAATATGAATRSKPSAAVTARRRANRFRRMIQNKLNQLLHHRRHGSRHRASSAPFPTGPATTNAAAAFRHEHAEGPALQHTREHTEGNPFDYVVSFGETSNGLTTSLSALLSPNAVGDACGYDRFAPVACRYRISTQTWNDNIPDSLRQYVGIIERCMSTNLFRDAESDEEADGTSDEDAECETDTNAKEKDSNTAVDGHSGGVYCVHEDAAHEAERLMRGDLPDSADPLGYVHRTTTPFAPAAVALPVVHDAYDDFLRHYCAMEKFIVMLCLLTDVLEECVMAEETRQRVGARGASRVMPCDTRQSMRGGGGAVVPHGAHAEDRPEGGGDGGGAHETHASTHQTGAGTVLCATRRTGELHDGTGSPSDKAPPFAVLGHGDEAAGSSSGGDGGGGSGHRASADAEKVGRADGVEQPAARMQAFGRALQHRVCVAVAARETVYYWARRINLTRSFENVCAHAVQMLDGWPLVNPATQRPVVRHHDGLDGDEWTGAAHVRARGRFLSSAQVLCAQTHYVAHITAGLRECWRVHARVRQRIGVLERRIRPTGARLLHLAGVPADHFTSCLLPLRQPTLAEVVTEMDSETRGSCVAPERRADAVATPDAAVACARQSVDRGAKTCPSEKAPDRRSKRTNSSSSSSSSSNRTRREDIHVDDTDGSADSTASCLDRGDGPSDTDSSTRARSMSCTTPRRHTRAATSSSPPARRSVSVHCAGARECAGDGCQSSEQPHVTPSPPRHDSRPHTAPPNRVHRHVHFDPTSTQTRLSAQSRRTAACKSHPPRSGRAVSRLVFDDVSRLRDVYEYLSEVSERLGDRLHSWRQDWLLVGPTERAGEENVGQARSDSRSRSRREGGGGGEEGMGCLQQENTSPKAAEEREEGRRAKGYAVPRARASHEKTCFMH